MKICTRVSMMASACATAAWRRSHGRLHDCAEVVDGVQEHVVELADFRLDVARHGQVDHEHRPVAARLDRALDHAQADDRQRRRGARHDDVELVQRVGQFGQAHRLAVEALRRASRRAPACGWRRRCARGFCAAKCVAHNSIISPAPMNSTFWLGDACRRCAAPAARRPPPWKRCARRFRWCCALPWRPRRCAGTAGSERCRGRRPLGGAHRVLHLAEDLRLAQHHRIEPGGDAERVAHGLVLRQRVQVRRSSATLQLVVLGQECAPASSGLGASAGRSRARCGCRSTGSPPRRPPLRRRRAANHARAAITA